MKIYSMVYSETKRRSRALAVASALAIIFALLLLFGLQAADPADAATRLPFSVNSTGDGNDLDFPSGNFDGTSDGICDASSTAGEQCTLRAAIQEANKLAGADTIHFDIPTTSPSCDSATGVCRILSLPRLPQITKPVTIDGYTQPGATENTLTESGKTDAVLKIELAGSSSEPGLIVGGSDASNTVIKGLVISGFEFGLAFMSSTGHRVEGNFIGTDPTGTARKGNLYGVTFFNTDGSTIGGTSPEARNLISGNIQIGVLLQPGFSGKDGSSGNKIQGNLIGTNRDGTSTPNKLGNGTGVFFYFSSNNTVGDADASDGSLTNAANTIAFNADGGVAVGSESTGNRILSNSIHSNGELGIDLAPGDPPVIGVTPNDPKDPDTGPNRLQNFPVLSFAQEAFGNSTLIGGDLNSTPSTRKMKRTFIIQFFSNPSTDPDGGKIFLGEMQVKTDRQGNASFGFEVSQDVASEGDYITATATNRATGDTSEFSEARVVEGSVIGGG